MDALAKIKYFLLVLIIFTFPIGVLGRFDLGNAIALTINDILVGILFVSFAISFILKKKIQGVLLIPILLFVLSLSLSLALNYKRLNFEETIASLSYLLRWIAYSSIYFTIVELELSKKIKVIKYLAVSGLITLVLGFIQLLIYPNLKNLFYAGWDEHLYRIFGTFLDPNFTGIIFTLLFILLLALKPPIFKNHKINFFIAIIVFLSIVLTFSRSSILAFTACLIFYAYLTKDKLIIYGLSIALICISGFYILIPKQESTNVFRTASILARVDSYQEGFKIFVNNPLFGVGFNSYRYALEDYGFKDEMKFGPSHGASSNDNSFLFVLATGGIVGFLAFIFLIYKAFMITGRNALFKNISLVCVIIGSFFVNAFFFVFILEWLWIVLGSTENT